MKIDRSRIPIICFGLIALFLAGIAIGHAFGSRNMLPRRFFDRAMQQQKMFDKLDCLAEKR